MFLFILPCVFFFFPCFTLRPPTFFTVKVVSEVEEVAAEVEAGVVAEVEEEVEIEGVVGEVEVEEEEVVVEVERRDGLVVLVVVKDGDISSVRAERVMGEE